MFRTGNYKENITTMPRAVILSDSSFTKLTFMTQIWITGDMRQTGKGEIFCPIKN
jgi:hypothetical protein